MDIGTYKLDEKQAILNYQLVEENDNIAKRYENQLVNMELEHFRDFLMAINKYAKDSCLDLGSSYGAQYFAMKINCPNIKWYGCEIAQQFIDKFISRFKDYKPEIYKIDNYLQLPFKDDSFDIVTSRSFLYHYSFNHAKQIIDEMLRVSKNGILIMFRKEIDSEEEKFFPLFGINSEKGYYVDWNKKDWEEYLSNKKYIKLSDKVYFIEKWQPIQ